MADVNLSSFIWAVADLLRGDYKQSEYGKVILPFTVLRRLDCVLAPTKAAVLAELATRKKAGLNPEPFVLKKAGQHFYNTSELDLKRLVGDQDHIGENLRAYVQAFSPAVRDIFERFDFHVQIDRLAKAGLLYLVTEKFATIDLHPAAVSNAQMGAVFEELIRKFAELSNETAGEHFTPREVIALMVNLLFIEDDEALSKPGVVRSLYDPTAGTGGMLSVAGEHLAALNPRARLVMYGQELNPESYAICKADMLIKGQDIANIVFGNTLSADGLPVRQFDYMLSNPPFGVEWKKIEREIRREHEQQGFNGRFGPGLPRVSDGSLLFLLHLLSKMRSAKDGGSRFGIVLNGSPLFTGGAGSGESEIRRYVLEGDLLEAIVGLPTDMFYNTGISTYVWIVSNRKPAARRGNVQLIDASACWQKMRKSLGSKRKELSPAHIDEITRIFGEFQEVTRQGVPISHIFRNEDFGYRTITVERPARDEHGAVVVGTKGKTKGKPVADAGLRDTENVPFAEDVTAYFEREVLPHAPDAWIDHEKTKVGYEIPFNRHFYVFTPPRPLAEIDADLKLATDRIVAMMLDLLQEKRRTIISSALANGVSPDAPLRASTADYPGGVPSHWVTTKVKHIVESINQGWSPQCEGAPPDSEDQWAVLKVGCVNQGVFSWRESKLLPEELTPLPELALAADDILVSRANTRELVGSAAIVDRDYPRLMLCDKLYRLRLHRDRCLPAFLVRFLETRFARTQIEALATGASASMVNISQSTILELPIALPPLSEQVEIARAIESTTTELDLLSAASRQTLDLLQERRSALINAAVTGQTSIRGLVPADAALTAETTAAGAP